tara:strand:- start:390 stop:515 length:126 start_codon:yes stop_codon:yes gene_type:complete
MSHSIALILVGGAVEGIGRAFLQLPSTWSFEIDLRPFNEVF